MHLTCGAYAIPLGRAPSIPYLSPPVTYVRLICVYLNVAIDPGQWRHASLREVHGGHAAQRGCLGAARVGATAAWRGWARLPALLYTGSGSGAAMLVKRGSGTTVAYQRPCHRVWTCARWGRAFDRVEAEERTMASFSALPTAYTKVRLWEPRPNIWPGTSLRT